MSKVFYTLPIGTNAGKIVRQLREYGVPAEDATLNAQTVCPVPRIAILGTRRLSAEGISQIERHLEVTPRFSHIER